MTQGCVVKNPIKIVDFVTPTYNLGSDLSSVVNIFLNFSPLGYSV